MNPKKGDRVEIAYRIWYLENEEEVVLDQSGDSNLSFNIGIATLPFAFLAEQLQDMTANASKQIEVPCSSLYGPYGHPLLSLAPSHTLSLRLYLVNVSSAAPTQALTEKYQTAVQHKEEGNKFVAEENYHHARASYIRGISCYVEELDSRTCTADVSISTLLTQFFNNMAMCELKLKRYNLVLDSCSTVLSLEPDDPAKSKAHHRLGEAIYESRREYIQTKSSRLPDKDWGTKEAQYHFVQSHTYSKGTNGTAKKRIQELDSIIKAPKGFAGMFNRESNLNRGLPKF